MDFIQKLKKSFWVLHSSSVDQLKVRTRSGAFSGVQISEDYILTCAHHGGDDKGYKIKKIKGRKIGQTSFEYNFVTVYVRPDMDLRLLKCTNRSLKNYDYSNISNNENLNIGELLYSIGNATRGTGSFYKHYVAFPCKKVSPSTWSQTLKCEDWLRANSNMSRYRTLGDFFYKQIGAETGSCCYHPSIPIVVFYGMATAGGCSGGPLFTGEGDVMGIVIGGTKYCTYAIHPSAINAFLVEAYSTIGKKRPGEDDSKGGLKKAKVRSIPCTYGSCPRTFQTISARDNHCRAKHA